MLKEFHVRPLYLDLFCVILIIALNPVSHFITFSPNLFTSDTIAYATMARDFFSKGLLYILSWGHIDTGLILPPLYPFLIVCGRIFYPETLNVAEYVSSICALMSTILIFLYLKQITSRIVGIITTVLIQINYYYFLIGMRPLSEAAFLLILSLALYLMLLMLKNNPDGERRLTAFLAGVACCLVFLSRQIGIIVSVFAAIICLIQWLTVSGRQRKILNTNLLFMLLGWLIIFVPYAIILYSQTGQHPFTQGFRKYDYVVTVKDPEIIKEIEKSKTLPPDLLEQTESEAYSDYEVIYAERRRMRKLLPDASEMFGYINIGIDEEESYLTKAFSNIIDLKSYSIKFYNNIMHLSSSLGNILTILFFLACLSSFLIKNHRIRFTAKVLLPFFIIFYLLAISFFTDKIPRYIHILLPFCLMHISIELYIRLNDLMDLLKLKRFTNMVLCAFILSLIMLTTPRFFTGLKLIPKGEGMESEYYPFQRHVNGAPVFCVTPLHSFIVGGSFRILPNDSLDKVAQYGKNTGVRWILIARTRSVANELKLYNNAQWYLEHSLEKGYPDLVKLRAGTDDRFMALYEIL